MKRLAVGNKLLLLTVVVSLLTAAGCASGPLTQREKGAGIGALGGAATGAIIGGVAGRPGTGALIGGLLGTGAGALVGDQLEAQDQRVQEQQRQIEESQRELERQRQELERLKKQQEYY